MVDLLPLPSSLLDLKSLRVSLAASVGDAYVVEVTLTRPQKMNALGAEFWREFPGCLMTLDRWSPCRCILLTADGPAFCSGIDIQYATSFFMDKEEAEGSEAPAEAPMDAARRSLRLRRIVKYLQGSVSGIEEMSKPIVAAVSGPCLGAGVDIICSCDIRLCALDALFSVKEVDLGMAPDIGTLQRLPRIVRSGSWVRDVCFSGRMFNAREAEKEGLVSAVYPDKDSLTQAAVSLCLSLASKSPVALAAIKEALNYSRGRPVDESLYHQVLCSSVMLQTDDIPNAIRKQLRRQKQSASRREAVLPFAAL